MSITILQSDHPHKAAARSLQTILEQTRGKVLLLLSGGSALAVLDHMYIPDPAYTTIGLIDERYTIDPKEQNINNILEKEMIMRMQEKGMTVISILNKNLEMDECVHEYEIKLRRWKADNPQGKIVCLLGIGADGHTAGIMPHPEHADLFSRLFENQSWVTAYNAGEKSLVPLRVTVTNSFLRHYADTAVAYVVGEQKREALAHLMVPFGVLAYTPVRILLEMKRVFVYTDIEL